MDRAPRDVIRQAMEGILADDYIPEPNDASLMDTRYRDAKLIPGTGAVVGSIGRGTMMGPSGIHLLAKDRDVVIVFERRLCLRRITNTSIRAYWRPRFD